MLKESLDLKDEVNELNTFLTSLNPKEWRTPTAFLQWTPWDVVAHLLFFDQCSLLALDDSTSFRKRANQIMEEQKHGNSFQNQAYVQYKTFSYKQLQHTWHETSLLLSDRLGELNTKQRIPWFGPDMAVKSFISARFMEVWAHGQEVYDLKQTERQYSDRIKHIVLLGVKTFSWAFINRQLDVPCDTPYIHLKAPSGQIWEWNEPNDEHCVTGSAVDFCHVVTQGRNIADVSLNVRGKTATQWMSIAQCFAGPPVTPPKPGLRT